MHKRPPLVTKTPGWNPHSLQFSPFHPDKIAVASAANFGIVGNGRLFIMQSIGLPPAGGAPPIISQFYDTQDGIFDVAWSECHDAQVATGGGDGSVKLFDLTLADFPIRSYAEHLREVYSVSWNMIEKNLFLSASWDLTIKLWNPESPHSITTWGTPDLSTGLSGNDQHKQHTQCIYQVSWCPHSPHIFASVSGDSTLKIWDTRQTNRRNCAMTINASNGEVLTLDWNKYNRDQIVTGGVDKQLKVWDIRKNINGNSGTPPLQLPGHGYAVRRVKCSPHDGNIVGSVSYDMTMRLWSLSSGQQVFVHDAHTEFVLGLDFNLFKPGQVATCSWDESVHLLSL